MRKNSHDLLIKDYLNTQGLTLDVHDVHMAQLAAKTVMEAGYAEIDQDVLWYADDDHVLEDYLPESNENLMLLRQVFMGLDSVMSRFPVSSAGVYIIIGQSEVQLSLLRLVSLGSQLPFNLCIDEAGARQSLLVRCVQTGWLSLVADVRQWLHNGDLVGNQPGVSQLAIPIHDQTGRIFGAVFICQDQPNSFSDETQAAWIGFSLALVPILIARYADHAYMIKK